MFKYKHFLLRNVLMLNHIYKMKVNYFESSQIVKTDIDTCWDFFSKPDNLKKITPEYMGFKVVKGGEEEMYPGQVIEYKVSPVLGIKQTWLTEITHVKKNSFFVDEQRIGPYKIWHHQHIFIPQDDGTVLMKDIVTYALPVIPFSIVINRLFVKRKLNKIFNHRTRVIAKLF